MRNKNLLVVDIEKAERVIEREDLEADIAVALMKRIVLYVMRR